MDTSGSTDSTGKVIPIDRRPAIWAHQGWEAPQMVATGAEGDIYDLCCWPWCCWLTSDCHGELPEWVNSWKIIHHASWDRTWVKWFCFDVSFTVRCCQKSWRMCWSKICWVYDARAFIFDYMLTHVEHVCPSCARFWIMFQPFPHESGHPLCITAVWQLPVARYRVPVDSLQTPTTLHSRHVDGATHGTDCFAGRAPERWVFHVTSFAGRFIWRTGSSS